VRGRKRHIVTDTLGLLLGVIVHPASVQDRDGAVALLRQVRRLFPFIERIIGDGGYQGPRMAKTVARTGYVGCMDTTSVGSTFSTPTPSASSSTSTS